LRNAQKREKGENIKAINVIKLNQSVKLRALGGSMVQSALIIALFVLAGVLGSAPGHGTLTSLTAPFAPRLLAIIIGA
jgi:hypothetical protein